MARVKRMGRVMPPPFKRKSISLTIPKGKQRSWKYSSICDVQIGDTIAEFGLVDDIGVNQANQIILVNIEGVSRTFDPDKVLLVFC